MKFLTKRFRDRLLKHTAKKQDLDRLYSKIFAAIQVDRAMRGEQVLPPDNSWSMGLDAITLVLAEIQPKPQPRVLEFGSGRSTVILATALRNLGGSLMSIEHDPVYATQTERELRASGLEDTAEIRLVPLAAAESGDESRSYDLADLSETRFDVVIIDGPPAECGRLGRWWPLSWSLTHVKQDGVIFLDDADRANESACLARLESENQEWATVRYDTEKGLARITRHNLA